MFFSKEMCSQIKTIFQINQVFLKKTTTHFVEAGSKSYCNKWMEGNCFKAKKDFIKREKRIYEIP